MRDATGVRRCGMFISRNTFYRWSKSKLYLISTFSSDTDYKTKNTLQHLNSHFVPIKMYSSDFIYLVQKKKNRYSMLQEIRNGSGTKMFQVYLNNFILKHTRSNHPKMTFRTANKLNAFCSIKSLMLVMLSTRK